MHPTTTRPHNPFARPWHALAFPVIRTLLHGGVPEDRIETDGATALARTHDGCWLRLGPDVPSDEVDDAIARCRTKGVR